MKLNNKQILEAINKGILLALDGFEDQDDIQTLTHGKIKNEYNTKKYIDLINSYVDLGLPSGTLWCKYNFGAKSETEIGNLYAWGETKTKDEKDYTWYTYKFTEEPYHEMKVTKYCTSRYNGYKHFVDNLSQLLKIDDVVYLTYANSKYNFHIPTNDLCYELIKNTTPEWIGNYLNTGLNGRRFISKINGNSIFLLAPISEYYSLDEFDTFGAYWTSTLTSDSTQAYKMSINNKYACLGSAFRPTGLPIRPVLNIENL